MTKPKTAPEIMEEMAKAPSLDRFFDRDPKTLTDADYKELIAVLRAERPFFDNKGDK